MRRTRLFFALIICQLFFFTPIFGQYIFLSSAEPFVVINSNSTIKHQAIWLKIVDFDAPVQIQTTDGKMLNRFFKAETENPSFVIAHNKIRYRPNAPISKADTLLIVPQKNIATNTVTEKPALEENSWKKTLNKIEGIPYEWEKSEKIIAACQAQTPPCEIYISMLKCLKYDASRVIVINATAGKQDERCQEKVVNEVAEIHKSEIIIK